jgi:serine/threonine protein kinase
LVAAHARNILHRDIKAANIMVTPDSIKVLDFGLAKLRDEQHKTLPPPKRPEDVSTPPSKLALDETMPSNPPSTSNPDMTLDETAPAAGEVSSYRTHAGQMLGTPLYMAPEQVDGLPPDERSEVFSVGVLAHEILSGKPPYTATSMDELFRQIKTEPPPALDEIPDAIVSIVARAIAKDLAERFPTMLALRDAVRAERIRRFAPRAHR